MTRQDQNERLQSAADRESEFWRRYDSAVLAEQNGEPMLGDDVSINDFERGKTVTTTEAINPLLNDRLTEIGVSESVAKMLESRGPQFKTLGGTLEWLHANRSLVALRGPDEVVPTDDAVNYVERIIRDAGYSWGPDSDFAKKRYAKQPKSNGASALAESMNKAAAATAASNTDDDVSLDDLFGDIDQGQEPQASEPATSKADEPAIDGPAIESAAAPEESASVSAAAPPASEKPITATESQRLRLAHLERIQEANRLVLEIHSEWEESKAETASLKKRYDEAAIKLSRLIETDPLQQKLPIAGIDGQDDESFAESIEGDQDDNPADDDHGETEEGQDDQQPETDELAAADSQQDSPLAEPPGENVELDPPIPVDWKSIDIGDPLGLNDSQVEKLAAVGIRSMFDVALMQQGKHSLKSFADLKGVGAKKAEVWNDRFGEWVEKNSVTVESSDKHEGSDDDDDSSGDFVFETE